ncbi:flagellar biosynthetic protein FliR [Leptospira sp. GIMC2001]|uniref:flagellar biosynthetic protein FliR n=1 Tax=Leptospira sp. GIMC2001 TaxID=1513297 RepID=UPI0004A5C6CA|nr:flagellar biosynthetic protein FliR [Leptospira sp. GIMC2001]AID56232.1 flagellar biosynthesis protein FliR [Leptospira sp. GIMC2001]WCL48272.1 flagellar biosynthetic protein FliR [Leptospira sp. GIMC2001]
MEGFVYNFQTFMLMFARLLGLFMVTPVFSSESVPVSLRMIFSFLVTLIMFPVSFQYMPSVPGNMVVYGLLVLSEIFIGLMIGFIIAIFFAAFQMAGDFFNVQLGFAYTEVLDPMSQVSLPVVSTLKNLIAILVFLTIGAHRMVISSLAYSFEKVRIIEFTEEVNLGIYRALEQCLGAMFLVAFKIALPVLGILLLVTIAEALMGKAAPQLNILQLSFPIKVVIGLIVLIAVMGFIVSQMESAFQVAFDKIDLLFRGWPN